MKNALRFRTLTTLLVVRFTVFILFALAAIAQKSLKASDHCNGGLRKATPRQVAERDNRAGSSNQSDDW